MYVCTQCFEIAGRQIFCKNVQCSDEEFIVKIIQFSLRETPLTCYTSVLTVENILEIPPNFFSFLLVGHIL
jgi:hypothetical protein